MQCEDVVALASQYLEGDTTRAQAVQIKEHLQTCAQCAAAFAQRQNLINALNTLPVPDPATDLAVRIVRDRQRQQAVPTMSRTRTAKDRQWRWYWAGVGSSLAAGIVLFLLVDVFSSSVVPGRQTTVHTTLNQLRKVNILVHSAHAIDNVKFSIAIPVGLELQGYSGRRQLVWRGKLESGENLLSLPVVAVQDKASTLVMRIEYQNASKEYRVNVDVNSG
jgi:hypothetical protein